MINKTFLSKIKKNLETYQEERNKIIGSSREVLQNSKKAIFALHAGKSKDAKVFILNAERDLISLNKIYNKGNRLRFEGSFKAAVEEYVEAKMFATVLENKSLSELKIQNIGPEEYIGGLSDLTGELVRKAVLEATNNNHKELKRYKEICEEVVEFLLTLYLTGHLRQKFDAAKRNFSRLEQIIYECRS